jgi:hypothetical protein
LFYRGLGHPGAERFDIGSDVERLDVGELADPGALDPSEELRHGPVIGHAGVLVADGGGKELQEPSRAWSPAAAMVAGTAMPRAALMAGGPGRIGVIFRNIFGRILQRYS